MKILYELHGSYFIKYYTLTADKDLYTWKTSALAVNDFLKIIDYH